MEQAGLADPRLSHYSDDLSMTSLNLLDRPPELLHLGLPSDETHEPAFYCNLQAGTQQSNTEYFINVDRLAHSLHPRGAERLELEITFRQFVRVFAHHDRTWCSKTL